MKQTLDYKILITPAIEGQLVARSRGFADETIDGGVRYILFDSTKHIQLPQALSLPMGLQMAPPICPHSYVQVGVWVETARLPLLSSSSYSDDDYASRRHDASDVGFGDCSIIAFFLFFLVAVSGSSYPSDTSVIKLQVCWLGTERVVQKHRPAKD
ncbi:hypothetical protein IFM89_016964 [Coptis chinensis]|uniref:Uncharacterized protein n=1 Tax=Coptis chinensis TaxID=261450 RepID=A0A835HVY6_9MAGN|nr:hypothetical protein IFM89_016964 [Coptis chinensis]